MAARTGSNEELLPCPSCEKHIFPTEDSASLSALHWSPPSDRVAEKNPVLLVHGMGNNAALWELTGPESIPMLLAKRGFHVWAVDLRRSESLPKDVFTWRIEDYILKDIPATISYIREKHVGTQQENEKIHYVGHSMGAVIGFSLLATPARRDLKSFVSIAGSTFYSHSYWRFALCLVPCFSCCCTFIPLKPALWANGLLALCFGCTANFAAFGCNIRNSVLASIQMNHFHSIPMELVYELKQMTEDDGLKLNFPPETDIIVETAGIQIEDIDTNSNTDGPSTPWESRMKAIHSSGSLDDLPILALVGDYDLQCREPDVLRTMSVTAPFCQYQKTIVLGKDKLHHGGKSFGHFDLIAGIYTGDIVAPLLVDWFIKSQV